MPIPRAVAHINRVATNKVARHIAPRMRGGGVLIHAGRVSGREYHTPVRILRFKNGYVIPLTYGSESDWVKNVRAAGGGRLEHLGEVIDLTDPRFITEDEVAPYLMPHIRVALSLLNVHEFLALDEDM